MNVMIDIVLIKIKFITILEMFPKLLENSIIDQYINEHLQIRKIMTISFKIGIKKVNIEACFKVLQKYEIYSHSEDTPSSVRSNKSDRYHRIQFTRPTDFVSIQPEQQLLPSGHCARLKLSSRDPASDVLRFNVLSEGFKASACDRTIKTIRTLLII